MMVDRQPARPSSVQGKGRQIKARVSTRIRIRVQLANSGVFGLIASEGETTG
jgi:hypothetical protein